MNNHLASKQLQLSLRELLARVAALTITAGYVIFYSLGQLLSPA
jgi:hypothetical protein